MLAINGVGSKVAILDVQLLFSFRYNVTSYESNNNNKKKKKKQKHNNNENQ